MRQLGAMQGDEPEPEHLAPRPEAILHGVATALGLVQSKVKSTSFVEEER